VVRVVTDLGLVNVDPERNPSDPLRPAPPRDEPLEPLPVREPERVTGVSDRKRWIPLDGLGEGTVTVLEVMMPEHNWLGTHAVWYRWDGSRAGHLLPADEFKRRFRPA
jgi:hypothetical protein